MSSPAKNIVLAVISVYFFISSIVLIKSSASLLGESLAEGVVRLIRDTTGGVLPVG